MESFHLHINSCQMERFFLVLLFPTRVYSKDDEYRGAYDRATLQKERQMIMQAWGDYCTSEIV